MADIGFECSQRHVELEVSSERSIAGNNDMIIEELNQAISEKSFLSIRVNGCISGARSGSLNHNGAAKSRKKETSRSLFLEFSQLARCKSCKWLNVVVHRELVRMWAETERVVFLLLHVDPVGDEVGVEDVAAQEEGMISLERFDRAAE